MRSDLTSLINEDLLPRLPLPLAQLARRAHNAKTPLDRHLAAYYLWEASLKLLGAVAVAEYAGLNDNDAKVRERLQALARPALGHWWEFVRTLLPVLAESGDAPFQTLRERLLGRSLGDFPRSSGLNNMLKETLEGTSSAGTNVRLSDLFDRLVQYRNSEIGHGAAGQRSAEFYDRLGTSFLGAAMEFLERIDLLAGRRLISIEDVRRLSSGEWLVERFALIGETPRRLESLTLPGERQASLPSPDRVLLVRSEDAALNSASSLHPLMLFDGGVGHCYFLNARRRRARAEYLCYTTGETVQRESLVGEHRELLADLLGSGVTEEAVSDWAARSQAEESTGAVEDDSSARTLGDYELRSRIGQGGMGAVYRAWQPSLGREVALKTLLRSGDPKAEARFSREIRALGRVEHQNLIKIFTSGSHAEQWFYTMELIEGADLAAVCERLGHSEVGLLTQADWRQAISSACEEARQAEKPLSDDLPPTSTGDFDPNGTTLAGSAVAGRGYIERIVESIRQSALAAHALHQAGVVHRDIKPGNIMVTPEGDRAVLMDLGLAQIADESEGRLTRTRQFVGTLRYASPEQVLSVPVDVRTDVYSLGATLWELLTLQPLFGATEQMPTPELMLKIQSSDPEPPRRINPAIPEDLEAIVLKCLDKDRTRRYGSAHDLAEDLARWQRGDPVQAQAPTLRYLLGRYVRRHRAKIAAIAGGVLAAFVIISSLGIYAEVQRREAVEQRRAAVSAADAEREAKEQAIAAQVAETAAKERAERAAELEREAKEAAEEARGQAEAAATAEAAAKEQALAAQAATEEQLLRAEWLLYASQIAGARLEWEMNNADAAWKKLEATRGDFRGWEFNYLYSLFNQNQKTFAGHDNRVNCVAVSPDGQRIASGGYDNTVKVSNLISGEELRSTVRQNDHVDGLAFSPDGVHIVGCCKQTVTIWDVETLTAVRTWETGQRRVWTVSYSPDGARIVSSGDDRSVKVWDAATGEELVKLTGHTAGVMQAVFSPDGTKIFSGSSDRTVRVWDAASGEELWIARGHADGVSSLAVAPDGARLVTGSKDDTIKVWDAASGEELLTLPGHSEDVTRVAFSHDGRRIASASRDGTVRLWNAATGREDFVLRGHRDHVNWVAFSPDAETVVSASDDQTVKAWSVRSAQGPVTRTLTGDVNSVAFSPDGTFVVSGSADGLFTTPGVAQVWEFSTGAERHSLRGHEKSVTSVAVSPDGKKIASGSWDGTVRVWDAATGAETLVFEGHTGKIESVAFSPDGAVIASATSEYRDSIKLWDADSGEVIRTLSGHTRNLSGAAFSPDGTLLAAGAEQAVKVWNAETGEELVTLTGHTSFVNHVCFSGDGGRIVSAGSDLTVRIWDTASGELLLTLRGHTSDVLSAVFSPDGRRIASSGHDETIRLWDAETGFETFALRGHASPVRCIAFSPDGSRLASGSGDYLMPREMKLWDASQGPELPLIRRPARYVASLAVSGDGTVLVSGQRDQVTIWDPATGQERLTLEGELQWVQAVAVTPDGERLAASTPDSVESGGIPVLDTVTGEILTRLSFDDGSMSCLAFSQDGSLLAGGGFRDESLIWEVGTGEVVQTLSGHQGEIASIAFSPDGRTIAGGGQFNDLYLWDFDSGELLHTLKGHSRFVSCAAFNPDGGRIASGSGDQTVKVWDARSGELKLTLQGHTHEVSSVDFSRDGLWIVSGSHDRSIRVWDAKTGEAVRTLRPHTRGVTNLVCLPGLEQLRIVSASDDGTMAIVTLPADPAE